MNNTSYKKNALIKSVVLLFFACMVNFTDAQPSSTIKYLQNFPLPTGYTTVQLRYRNDIAVDNTNNSYVAFQRIGLGKYDGNAWTMFNVANGSLLSDTVTSVAVNASGDIYAGTANGLSVYANSQWTHYNSLNSPLPAKGVTTVEVNNNVYVGTNNGLYIFDGTTWTVDNTSNSSLGNDSITSIAFDGTHIYVGTKNGVYHKDGLTWSQLVDVNPSLHAVSDIECNAGEVWIALPDGSIYYYDALWVPHQVTLPPKTSGCTDFSTNNNGTCLKADNGYIYFFITDPNNSKSLLCRSNQTHSVFTNLCYANALSFGAKAFLFDIKNGFTSGMVNFNASNQFSDFFAQNISAIPLIKITTDFLEPSNLNINQVNARINNDGEMHWDPVAQTPIYEVPACSGLTSIFSSGFWIGGMDNQNQLRGAAMTYSQMGAQDFHAGPLDTITGQPDSIAAIAFNRTWKVSRSEIEDFIYNYQQGNVANGTYDIPEVIVNWPAHGGGTFSNSLAPFVDTNADGIYNPMDGDYPSIDGDQEIWFIFNDVRTHTETYCQQLGIEIHGKAYAYNCTAPVAGNDVINYTTFYQYKIINRTNDTYNNVVIGLMVDPDLGNAADDYVGCNVNLSTGFVYNSDIDDDAVAGYGLKPPYQNVTILKGPLADENDGIDNDRDGTTDEPGECQMMSNFMYYTNVNNDPIGNPAVCDDYYDYMNSTWLDGIPITYGGMGRDPGMICHYMFPGTTDPAFPGQNWTMANAGLFPNDMRFVISSGQFTMQPRSEQTFDFAYIYTRDTVGNWPVDAEANNVAQVEKVIQWYNNGLVSCPAVGINEHNSNAALLLALSPNPASDFVALKNINIKDNYIYTVTDVTGRICLTGKLSKSEINVSKLQQGEYQVQLRNDNEIRTGKFVKL